MHFYSLIMYQKLTKIYVFFFKNCFNLLCSHILWQSLIFVFIYINQCFLMFVLFTIHRYKMILGAIFLRNIGVQNDPLICLHKNANKNVIDQVAEFDLTREHLEPGNSKNSDTL